MDKALKDEKEEKNGLEMEFVLMSLIQKVEIETIKADFEKEKSELKRQMEAKEAKLEKEKQKREALQQREVDELVAQMAKLNLNDKPLDENRDAAKVFISYLTINSLLIVHCDSSQQKFLQKTYNNKSLK